MATGYGRKKNRKRSSVKDSDELNRSEFSCSPCTKEGKESKAVNYCVECGDFFCSGCMEFHNRITALSFHEVLHEEKMSEFYSRSKPSFPTQRCQQHHGRLVDTFCPEHDVVCCTTCVSISHRNCEGIQYLPDIAQGVKESENFQNLTTSMKECFKAIDVKENLFKEELSKSSQLRENYVQTVEKYTKKMKDRLEQMRANAVAEIHAECNSHEEQINVGLEKLNDLNNQLETAWNSIHDDDDDNESQIFVHAKNGQAKLSELEAQLAEVEKPTKLQQFLVNFDIQEFLCEQTFGSFGDSLTVQEHIMANDDDDEKVCDITGVAICPETGFILADWANKKLKRLSDDLELTESCSVSHSPWAVCFISSQKVAVTFPSVKTVGLFDVDDDIVPLDTFKVGKTCRGVCENDDKLFIACDGNVGEGPGHVQVYSLEGRHLITVKKHGDSSRHIFKFPMHITTFEMHEEVYVADAKMGIVSIKINGQVIETACQDSTQTCTAICTNGSSSLFATDDTNRSIIQVSSDLKIFAEIVGRDDRFQRFQSLVYDASNSRLIATTENSNTILVYKF